MYKARDTRLDRMVAVKVSAAQFSERFEREARAVAALNHSKICTLHDVGPNYLVMEYIEGTNSSRGPLPLDQALKYAAIFVMHLTPHTRRASLIGVEAREYSRDQGRRRAVRFRTGEVRDAGAGD